VTPNQRVIAPFFSATDLSVVLLFAFACLLVDRLAWVQFNRLLLHLLRNRYPIKDVIGCEL